MNDEQLRALNTMLTYLGNGKTNEIVATTHGKWAWRLRDPYFSDWLYAFSGTLEECEQLKTEYEAPESRDHPF